MDQTPAGPVSGGTISGLFLTVRDLPRMLAFYRDTLGMAAYYVEEGALAFLRPGTGGPSLALYAGRESEPSVDSHWYFMVDVPDLDAAVRELDARGVEREPVVTMPFGRYAKFRDPEGNLLEVHQPA